MYDAPPSGGDEQQADPAFPAVLRMQRRRHRWGLSVFWFLGGLLLCAGINSSANSDGTPSPPWFIDLTIAFGVATGVALFVAIGYTLVMRRFSAELRAQAFALERQRLRRQWRYGWAGRASRVLFWLAASLGMALFLAAAVLGVPWAVHGAAYLAGDRSALQWSGDLPVHDDGDAVGSIVIGVAFVLAGVRVVWFIVRRVTRVWWPRLVARRASDAVGGVDGVGAAGGAGGVAP